MDANILEAIDEQERINRSSGVYRRATLKDIIVYGRLRCVIKRPTIIPDNLKDGNGYFCLVDVFALKCQGEDYFKEGSNYDIGKTYLTRGSLIAYLAEPSKWVGKDIRLWGKSYGGRQCGCDIRRQGSKNTSGIVAFVFGSPETQGKKKVYPILCNSVEELAMGSRDCRGTVLEEFMVKLASAKNNEIPYSKSLDSIIPFTGIDSYEEISVAPIEKEEKHCEYQSVVSDVPVSGSNERIDISKIDMNLVFHLDGQPRSQFCDSFKEDIDRCCKSRDSWIKGMIEIPQKGTDYSDMLSKLRSGFIKNIASNYNKPVGKGDVRCREFVKKFISNCENTSMISGTLSESVKKGIRLGCDELKKFVATEPQLLWGDDDPVNQIPCIWDEELFAVNVISTCTGIPYDSLSSSFRYVNREYDMGIDDFLHALIYTPYLLGLVSSGLSLVDCDSLYYGVSANSECIHDFVDVNGKTRSYMAMLYTLKSVCDGSNTVNRQSYGAKANTFVPKTLYKAAVMQYGKRWESNVKNFEYPLGMMYIDCLRKLFSDKYLGISLAELPYIIGEKHSWYNEDDLKELEDIGVVNTLGGFIALEGTIEQEYCIYSTFEYLGKQSTGITEEQISKTIEDFESSRGFKLESLQKEGVKLCMKRAGVLSGCAGSGKTTTSDCLTEVLKTYLGNKPIVYCTPTGKACKRLAEVVRGTVKTIHSQFHLGLESGALIPRSYVSNSRYGKSQVGTIYIMDEMAMCSTELMFNVARNLSQNDMIFFLGDIKQLPPVGSGCPFKALMTLLPCVELGVSKRAAAGSLVNYNTTLINFMSDRVPAPLMYDDSTFMAAPCDNNSIVQTTVSAFKKFIDGTMNGTKYSEDDIQVISGYQKEEKASSVGKLNPAIQKVLRGEDSVLFAVEKRNSEAKKYYLGDRVIYINANSYDLCRYIPDGGNSFKTLVTLGIVNGDMGKIVGVLDANSIEFKECNLSDYAPGSKLRGSLNDKEIDSLFARRDERADSIREDSAYRGEGFYFVAVQVYDTDLGMDVVVLLRARGKYVGDVLVLSGGDLGNLDLAYALTCHKMQGSQSPVVIVPLERGSSPRFINRNMINTMVTRSQGIVCMVGDIEGNDSALGSGRRCKSDTKSHDLLSILTGDTGWVG